MTKVSHEKHVAMTFNHTMKSPPPYPTEVTVHQHTKMLRSQYLSSLC